jgi:hypothetical protein
MTTPLPPLPPLPDLDTPCALWKLIGAWGRANADSDIREKALCIDAEVHRLMQAYATAYGEAVAAALAPKWLPISEAPKDGTSILGWNAEYGARETRSLTCTPGSIAFAEGRTDRWWQWDEPKHNWTMRWEPTHFMPLTTPPKGETP